MAEVTRVHPEVVATEWEQVGKKITWFTVDYIADISASTGPTGLIAEAYQVIQTTTTIIAAGPLFDTGSQQTFGVEGVFAAADLTAIETALGAGGNNAGTTVTAKTLAIATV